MLVSHIAGKTFDNNEMFIGGLGGMLKKSASLSCSFGLFGLSGFLVERN
jgi:hypothetical protein